MLNEIQKVRDRYQEPFFCMALYHLLENGFKHFTEGLIAEAKKSIRESDAALTAKGKMSIMSVSFQDEIIDCAAELSKFGITDILRFIKHYLYFRGDDKVEFRCKNCDEILSGDEQVLVNDGYEDAFFECDLCHEHSMEYGSVILCEACGNYYTHNHCKETGEDTCPYCSD